jgi:PAS domain S-box-containing protein
MQQEIMRAAVEPDDDARTSILVVDDDKFSRDLLVRRLQRAGYLVVSTDNGRDVPRLLDAQVFNLVLLDVVMPLIGGREVLDTVRRRYGLSELPVIMVSSKTEGDEIAECFRHGANDYVTKPFETHALLARIEAHIGRQRAEAELRQARGRLELQVEERTAVLVRANHELEQCCDVLTGALEAISSAFVLWDESGRLVLCNERYREFYGRNASLVQPGVAFEDLLRMQAKSGALRAAIGRGEEWLEERLARHRNPAGPFEVELADGTWMLVSETRTANGYTVGLCTDITAIKRRKIALKTFAEMNRRLAAAVNAANSAILITDPVRLGNPTVFANPAFTAMTGWPVEEALGRDHRMLAGADTDKAALDRLERCMRDGVPASAELKLYARDGRSFRAEISASPIRNNAGEIINWVIILMDVTSRRESMEHFTSSRRT